MKWYIIVSTYRTYTLYESKKLHADMYKKMVYSPATGATLYIFPLAGVANYIIYYSLFQNSFVSRGA